MRDAVITKFTYKGYTGVVAHLKLKGPDQVVKMEWFCGYVVIPEKHPLYRKHYIELERKDIDINVHGGLTYSDDHLLVTREWCLGFDCNHFMDDPKVQDFEYTKEQVYLLIDRVIELENLEFKDDEQN